MNTILVGVIFVLVGATVSSAEPITGILTVNDVQCVYAELEAIDLNRGLRLCWCSTGTTCTYYPNNPYVCAGYNDDNHDFKTNYYQALAESAMENGQPCTKESISENLCNLEYPCLWGDCPGADNEFELLRKRRDVNAPACPLVPDDGSSNPTTVSTPNSTATTASKGVISVYVGLLITLVLMSL